MNSFRKILIKSELCGNFLSSIKSDKAQATIEWMKSELDEAIVNCVKCAGVSNLKKEIDAARKFTEEKRKALKDLVPEPIPALFLVSVVTHILSDIEGTKYFKHFESILNGCLNLEEYAEKDCVETRILSCAFADKLENIMDEY